MNIGPNLYEQILQNSIGCDSVVLLELFVLCPESKHTNVITPTVQDGINDYFKPFGSGGTTNAEIEIFNRWGKTIYKANVYSDSFWDGKTDGVIVPGVYFYSIDTKNGCVYHGSITVF